jgi:uroporphyrinogen-III synthase
VRSLANGQIDLVMFTSSVQFVHAARVAGEIGLADPFTTALKRTVIASIGPIASETLRKNGINVDFEPSHPKMGFLVKEAAERSAELVRKKSANAS